MQIQKTTDYKIFKGVAGNRKIQKNHVISLTKSIAKKNMLAQNPIIVNENMQVIDGQHRLEVAKVNKLEIYYIVSDGMNLDEVQQLNAYVRPWRGVDYLESYSAIGNPEYLKIKEFMATYGLSMSTSLEILAGGRHHTWTNFKRGDFKVINEEVAHLVAEMLQALKPYCELRTYADKDFVRAVMTISNDVSSAQLIAKLEVSGKLLEVQVDKKSYIRQFEDVINWKNRREFTRLY